MLLIIYIPVTQDEREKRWGCQEMRREYLRVLFTLSPIYPFSPPRPLPPFSHHPDLQIPPRLKRLADLLLKRGGKMCRPKLIRSDLVVCMGAHSPSRAKAEGWEEEEYRKGWYEMRGCKREKEEERQTEEKRKSRCCGRRKENKAINSIPLRLCLRPSCYIVDL